MEGGFTFEVQQLNEEYFSLGSKAKAFSRYLTSAFAGTKYLAREDVFHKRFQRVLVFFVEGAVFGGINIEYGN